MDQTQPPAGLELEAGFFPLAFLLFFFKPRVEIDGAPAVQLEWGTNHLPLNPGQHSVLIYFPYIFMKQCGKAELTINVPQGQVAQVRYRGPWWFILARGKASQTGQRPMVAAGTVATPAGNPAVMAATASPTATPAGWHPDPQGRHEQRYWDGQAWTASVSDAGVASTDPL